MHSRYKSALAVLALVPAFLAAQTVLNTAKSPWQQEPTSVLGIELSVALNAQSNITECPTLPILRGSDAFRHDYSFKGYCHERPYSPSDTRWLRNKPELGFPYGLRITTNDNHVHQIVITTNRSNLPDLRALLIARYGPPHRIEQATYKNLAGASLDGSVAKWTGEQVEITLAEYSTDLEVAEVIFTTRAYLQEVVRDREDKANRNKSKL